MKESKDLRLEEEARENANPQEEATTTEEGMKDQTEAVEEKEVNEHDSEEKNEEGEEDENEEKENSSTRKILIFSIVGVVAAALVITLCIVFASSTRKDKQEEVQQTDIEEEAEQPTTIEEATEVEAESTPEPTAETTPEPTEEPKQAASLEEYIAQLDPNEICVVVWNENTNRQEKFTEDQKCIVKDGDIVVVPVDERPIMSVYYGDISQKYDEKGYYVVNVEGSEWLALSITYEIGNDEYNTLFLPTKKE